MIGPLNRLEACHVALIAALDRDDVMGIHATIGEFEGALDAVRAAGAWCDRPEILDLVQRIYNLSEAARIRVNFLTDLNQRRIEALATARGRPVPLSYGRDGRRAA